jgi:hypothetical protein
MSGRGLTGRSTLQLAGEFIKCVKEFENISYAKWWLNPWWWASKRWKREKLTRKRTQIVGELAVRYEGVMRQLFQRTGRGDFSSFIQGVWRAVQISALTMGDEKSFSKSMWDAYRANAASESGDLKPKFMLRQFVDEMSPSEERAGLRIVAYGSDRAARPGDREVLRLLEAAYPLLHTELLKRARDLGELTDGALPLSSINGIRSPFSEYKSWLFFS